jgi:hypothetical protein
MNRLPVSTLEVQAARERQRLRDSFSELQERVRETVDPRELMRAHAALSLLVVAVAGFALGYRLASGFTRP